MLAVLLFHNGFGWARGGWLGVSLFFTVSGYLITSLLVAEYQRTGSISLKRFWERRARRLLPASLLTLAGVVVFAGVLVFPDQLASLRADIFAALAYVANWRFIFADASYNDLFGAPSPVLHFWSLAIEEQFYLVFPLIAFFSFRRGGIRALVRVAAVLAALSLCAALLITGFDRSYYGTGIRAFEIMVGVLLALWHRGFDIKPIAAWMVRVLPLALLAAVGAMMWLPIWHSSTSSWAIPAFALLSAVITLNATKPPRWFGIVVESRPLVFLGQISYGVYLFHWPLFLWLTSQRVGATGWTLFGARMAATLAVATVSFYLMERPIRRGTLLKTRRTLVSVLVGGIVVVAIGAALLVPRSTASATPDPISAAEGEQSTTTTVVAPLVAAPDPEPEATEPEAELVEPTAEPVRILLVGDSTAKAIFRGLQEEGSTTGTAVVENIGLGGCGVIDSGEFRHQPGPGTVNKDECVFWQEGWEDTISEFQPDLIVVFYGPMDTMDRKIEGDSEFRSVGDPVYDAQYTIDFTEKIDVLAAAHTPILWATAPYVWADFPRGSGNRSLTTMPDRVDRLNELFAKIVALDQRVDLLDYGRRIDNGVVDVDFSVRPDGVHFSEETSLSLAQDWLLETLLSQYASHTSDRTSP